MASGEVIMTNNVRRTGEEVLIDNTVEREKNINLELEGFDFTEIDTGIEENDACDKFRITLVTDALGKGLKGDLFHTIGSENFSIEIFPFPCKTLAELFCEVETLHRSNSIGDLLYILGGLKDVNTNVNEIFDTVKVDVLNQIQNGTKVIVSTVPTGNKNHNWNSRVGDLQDVLAYKLKNCASVHFEPLNSFKERDWDQDKGVLSESGRGKIINRLTKHILSGANNENPERSVGHVCADSEFATQPTNMKIVNNLSQPSEAVENAELQRGCLKVTGKVNGKSCVIVLDTGASTSLCEKSLVDDYEIEHEGNRNLVNADGSGINVLGTTFLHLELPTGKIIMVKAQVVSRLPSKILIGMPTILAHGLASFLPETIVSKIVLGHSNSNTRQPVVQTQPCESLDSAFSLNVLAHCNDESLDAGPSERAWESDNFWNPPPHSPEISSVESANAALDNVEIPAELPHTFDINPELSEGQKQEIQIILNKHEKLFLFQPSKFRAGMAKIPKIHYELSDSTPVFKKLRRTAPVVKDFIFSEVNMMLDIGAIEPSSSPYSSPIVVAKNKDNKFRLCHDYTDLNRKFKPKKFVLPRISDILDSVKTQKFFCEIDLHKAYWQCPITEESKDCSAFQTFFGGFRYVCASFGICTLPGEFQERMDNVLGEHRFTRALVYIDNIIAFGRDWPTYVESLDLVLTRLEEKDFVLGPSKCKFGYQQMTLFGFSVGKEGFKNDPKRIEAIIQLPIPKTVRQCRSLIGAVNFVRQFIPDLASLLRPIIDLTKNNQSAIKWTYECQQSFNEIKRILSTEPVLVNFDESREVFIVSDCSIIGCGGALLQEDEHGYLRPVSYMSKLLTPTQSRWHSTEQELFAVYACLQNWHEYCYLHEVTIFSDNIALKFFTKVQNANLRLTKLAVNISQYSFKIHFIRGKMNALADFLSRNITRDTLGVEDEISEDEQEILVINSIIHSSEEQSLIERAQSSDEFCVSILKAINGEEVEKKIERMARQFEKKGNVLFKRIFTPNGAERRVVLPKSLVESVLKEYHDDRAHVGKKKLIMHISEKYYVPNIQSVCADYVKFCTACQKNKIFSGKKVGGMKSIEVEGIPLKVLGLDTSGPFNVSRNGFKHCVSLTDYFSKYLWATPTKSIDAVSIAEVIYQYICRMGIPHEIRMDNGSAFRSHLINELTIKLGVVPNFNLAHSHKSGGLVERGFRTIQQAIQCYTEANNPPNWCELIPGICLAYNSCPQATTKISPYEILFGRKSTLNIDLAIIEDSEESRDYGTHLNLLETARKLALQEISKEQSKQKSNFEKSHRNVEYAPGARVLILDPSRKPGVCEKFRKKWTKIGEITGRVNNSIYEVKVDGENGKTVLLQTDRLKPFYQRPSEP